MQPLPSEHQTFMETIFHKHVGVKRDNSFSLTEQLVPGTSAPPKITVADSAPPQYLTLNLT